jgi:hypothetical protein
MPIEIPQEHTLFNSKARIFCGVTPGFNKSLHARSRNAVGRHSPIVLAISGKNKEGIRQPDRKPHRITTKNSSKIPVVRLFENDKIHTIRLALHKQIKNPFTRPKPSGAIPKKAEFHRLI